ncbi:MAG TPA: hypothetical protein VFZ53_11110, partial [Polyangiaceae bacterium]
PCHSRGMRFRNIGFSPLASLALVTVAFGSSLAACSSKTNDGSSDDSNGGTGNVGGTATGGSASGAGGAAPSGGVSGNPNGGSSAAAGTGTTSGGSGGIAGMAGSGAGGSGGAGSGMGGSAGVGGGASGSGAGGSGGLVGNGCTPGRMTTTGTLMGRYGSTKPVIDGKEYFLQVNEWGSSDPQVMAYGGDFFFKMTTQMASRPTTGAPTGFPSMFIGANSRNSTMGSNLPKPVSALTTVPTTWVWNDNGTLADTTANVYNVAYDVWFSTSAAGEPNASGPTGGYLMVWLYDPPAAEPIGGDPMFEDVTIANVPGTWDIWIGPNGTRPCISYVRTETTMAMSFDLNDFIEDAVTNRPNTIQADFHLTNIFTGFEVWSGGVGLESTAFCAVVN